MTSTKPPRRIDPREAALDAIPPVERHEENGRLLLTRAFRGVTVDQAVRYLEHLGGHRTDDQEVSGEGWSAALSTQTVPVGPSYRLTQVTITWVGDPARVERVVGRFRLKAFRAPG